jgi:tetratricopeptide (TPR) repeat protein
MSEANVRDSLLAAKAAIKEGRYKDSLQHTKAALKADKNSSEAWILVGTAAFNLKEYEQGQKAYRRALENSSHLVAAWEGLADIFAAADDVLGEIEANEHLVSP